MLVRRPLYPVERRIVEKQAGPISVEVHGLAGGLTNNDLTYLVNAGIKQGYSGPVPPGVLAAPGPSLSMIWNVEAAGAPHPSVIITAQLLSSTLRILGRVRLGRSDAGPEDS